MPKITKKLKGLRHSCQWGSMPSAWNPPISSCPILVPSLAYSCPIPVPSLACSHTIPVLSPSCLGGGVTCISFLTIWWPIFHILGDFCHSDCSADHQKLNVIQKWTFHFLSIWWPCFCILGDFHCSDCLADHQKLNAIQKQAFHFLMIWWPFFHTWADSCAKNPPEVASVDECKVYGKWLYKHPCRERTAVLKM